MSRVDAMLKVDRYWKLQSITKSQRSPIRNSTSLAGCYTMSNAWTRSFGWSSGKSFSHRPRFRVVAVGGTGMLRSVKDALYSSPRDMHMGTTGWILEIVRTHVIDASFSSHLLIDEVCTMMDSWFGPDVKQILSVMLKARSHDYVEHVLLQLQSISVSAKNLRSVEALCKMNSWMLIGSTPISITRHLV